MTQIKRTFVSCLNKTDNDIQTPVESCLGTRIANQMYHGIDSSNSTLVHGEYDDDDCWDVDPACDMSTDRFTLEVKTPIPVAPEPPSE